MSRIGLLIAALLLVPAVACSNGDPGTADVVNCPQPGPQFVINKVTLPKTKTDTAIDLNGDGRVDNQLGNIFSALSANGVDRQLAEDQAVEGGTATELLSIGAHDSSLQNDDSVSTVVNKAAAPTAPHHSVNAGFSGAGAHAPAQGQYDQGVGLPSSPVFDGTGHFTIDNGVGTALLCGKLSNGRFSSNNPVTTTHPVDMSIHLFGFPDVAITLHGAHMTYRVVPAVPPIVDGQINGSLKQSDLSHTVVPAIARDLNREVQSARGGTPAQQTRAQQIEAIFDVGDGAKGGPCTDPDYSPGQEGDAAKDGVISSCEVATNSLIKNVLAPDVQIFDSSGNYHPNAANTDKDSLSIGVGFTAVPANY
ncbi:MAG: hypothetical protein E6G57_14740 [Actinobacteria bacterium]|nr:MAG: hypothetical protein E6G57_14740 [Actinomycetota bacterium]